MSPTLLFMAALAAAPEAVLSRVEGEVIVNPLEGAPHQGRPREVLMPGTRLQTGPEGRAQIRLADGTEARLRPSSDLRIDPALGRRGPAFVLSFGRLWTRVVGRKADQTRFEVRTANAVAGVRGTRFEVGVGGDGSVMVSVEEGAVAVSGAGSASTLVNAGAGVQAGRDGQLGAVAKAFGEGEWARWVEAHAFELEKEGLRIARGLRGQLRRRQARVDRLQQQQSRLRKQIQRRAREVAGHGAKDPELVALSRRLEELTVRLRETLSRTQAALDLFHRWGRDAAQQRGKAAETVSLMARDLERVAPGFIDLMEEGRAGSARDLDDMMNEMRPLRETLRDEESAADELFDDD